MDRKRGIGKDCGLPWPKLKGDMKFFRELTTYPDRAAVEKRWGLKAGESSDIQNWEDVSAMLKFAHPLPAASGESRNAVIMGRKTWESLPESYRPLPERFNAILSRTVLKGVPSEGAFVWPELHYALRDLSQNVEVDTVFLIGGGQVFVAAVKEASCVELYVTEIDAEFPCDTFFPETPDFQPVLSSPWVEEGGTRYRFRRYDRVS